MTWCNSCDDERDSTSSASLIHEKSQAVKQVEACPSCGHCIQCQDHQQAAASAIQDLPGLPAGVKFDPTDQELLEHLEGKVRSDAQKRHPLIDEFIPTLEGENGICYTHPERLPGVSRDGLIRHFFHRPSKAYTTGTRKRRKVHTDAHGGETRWHKTGKTRPVLVSGKVTGYKKILVLYTNYGKKKKPEKTNWVMHQYHLGLHEEEKDGELVVSKVFYQTQPRQCGSAGSAKIVLNPVPAKSKGSSLIHGNDDGAPILKDATINGDYYSNPSVLPYSNHGHSRASPPQLIPNFSIHAGGSSFLP